MKRITPETLEIYKTICARADGTEPLWQVLREYDIHPSMFYNIYKRVRGITWSQAHPREIPAPRRSARNINGAPGYAKYAHLMRRDEWLGTPSQLRAYLNTLEQTK